MLPLLQLETPFQDTLAVVVVRVDRLKALVEKLDASLTSSAWKTRFVDVLSLAFARKRMYALVTLAPCGMLRLRKRSPTSWAFPLSVIMLRSSSLLSMEPLLIRSSVSSLPEEMPMLND